jgi:two-component system cell cycle response regulator
MNVLIVEPSKSYAQLLQKMFEEHRFNASIASGESDAHQKLNAGDYQIVCLSMSLSEGDSLTLCQQIRSSGRSANTPILMLTSSTSAEAIEAAYAAGVTEVFKKQDFDSFELYLSGLSERLSSSTQSSGSILYLEDSPIVALTTTAMLEDAGFRVDHFTSLEPTIEAFSSHYYDLLITDVVLKGDQSGLAMVRAVREHTSKEKQQIPILALSIYEDDARKLELFRAGINDYVSKKVIPEEFLTRVRLLIANRQLLMKLHSKQQQLEQMAMTDQLTRLYNRHYLMDIVPKKISQALRQQYPISMLVIDIDKFKTINDSYGHDIGDKVLVAVAEVIASQSRLEDVVARLGGEEFVTVLGHCSLDDAIAKAEQIRALIEAKNPEKIAVTASFGVSTLKEGDDFSTLFARGDEAVYNAKETGRNKVVSELFSA